MDFDDSNTTDNHVSNPEQYDCGFTDSSASILIVDDNPTNLGVLSDFLGEMGFEVLVTTSGERALQKVHYSLPDLILLDVMMPGIDGFETCRRLKADPSTKSIPIIFMTALSEPQDRVKGLSLGAVDYIAKPFEQDEVLARVQLHLRLSALNQTLTAQNLQLQQEVETRRQVELSLTQLNEDLNAALENLQTTQLQLIQGEKLAALGQLVAGVAHEINNPITFINGNLNYVDQYMRELLSLIQAYQQEFPHPSTQLQDQIKEVDLDFIEADLPQISNSMRLGVNRISEIVKSLLTFSHLGGAEVKAMDLHEGIDSTLVILQGRLKATDQRPAIGIRKDYGDLPLVECYYGQLNQVFMNILSNGIDALEESLEQGQAPNTSSPEIWIRTTCQDDQVTIQISDNGPGMAEATQAKIFDAFFTTKPVGKGTGLGLSISYEIVVKKHHGQLTFNSTQGQGTNFFVTLPVQQPSEVWHGDR